MPAEIERELFLLLTTDEDVSDVVFDRVFPLVIPQDEVLPAIVYQRIATVVMNNLDSSGGGMENVVIQVDCYADTYETAKDLAAKVSAAIRGATSLTASSETPRESYEENSFRVSIDYSFWHTAS